MVLRISSMPGGYLRAAKRAIAIDSPRETKERRLTA
jgi:hypothetical protein